MNRYPVGVDVPVTIALVDSAGNALTPTAVSYVVRDEAEEILSGPTAIAGPYTASVTITVPAAINDANGGRTVEVLVTTAAGGPYVCTDSYLIKTRATSLVIPTTSFQTYLEAQMIADDIPNLTGWTTSDENTLIPALLEAYTRLTKFCYVAYDASDVLDYQSTIVPWDARRIRPEMWPIMPTVYFDNLPDRFVLALRRAQIVEANEMLSAANNAITLKRDAGLLSESIGESSMMFRSGTGPLRLPASRAALNYLKGFVDYSGTPARYFINTRGRAIAY